MQVALPKLIEMDATLMPDKLEFSVPHVPKAMYAKAMWYVECGKEERLHVVKEGEIYHFYLLSASCDMWKKIDALIVRRYTAMLEGRKPAQGLKFEQILKLGTAVHLLQYADDTKRCAPECPLNPEELVCNCKGFRHTGICSHVLALNHWLGAVDLSHSQAALSSREKRPRGGFRHGVRPALISEGAGKEGAGKKRIK